MSSHKPSLSTVEQLERELAKLLPADKNIVRRKKNGDIIYETVRPHYAPASRAEFDEVGVPEPKPDISAADAPNFLPDILPQTPMNQENGNIIPDPEAQPSSPSASVATSETIAPATLSADLPTTDHSLTHHSPAAITCHEAENSGNQETPDPLTDLLHRALAATKTRGRPPAFDDHARGQLVALLSVGMSMRQAASVLGVSHTTIQNTLKADPGLSEQITAARFQAQLQPLACVIREARRSWKAATWLLKYLDTKIATHEETPDEAKQRHEKEIEEFHAQARRQHIKTRHISS